MKSFNSDLGKHLLDLRKKTGQTLHQVSKGTDIDSPLLSKLERGVRLPTQEQIKRLSKYYKVPESELKIMATAERIIKEYGANQVTLEAITIVQDEIVKYIKLKK